MTNFIKNVKILGLVVAATMFVFPAASSGQALRAVFYDGVRTDSTLDADSVSRNLLGNAGIIRRGNQSQVIIAGAVNSSRKLDVSLFGNADSVFFGPTGRTATTARTKFQSSPTNSFSVPWGTNTPASVKDKDTLIWYGGGSAKDSLVIRYGARIHAKTTGLGGDKDSIIWRISGSKGRASGTKDSITTNYADSVAVFPAWAAMSGRAANTTEGVEFADTSSGTGEYSDFEVYGSDSVFVSRSVTVTGSTIGSSDTSWSRADDKGRGKGIFRLFHKKGLPYVVNFVYNKITLGTVSWGGQSLVLPKSLGTKEGLRPAGDSVIISKDANFAVVPSTGWTPGIGRTRVVIAGNMTGNIGFGFTNPVDYYIGKNAPAADSIKGSTSGNNVSLTSLNHGDSVRFFVPKNIGSTDIFIDTAYVYRGAKVNVKVTGATISDIADVGDSVVTGFTSTLRGERVKGFGRGKPNGFISASDTTNVDFAWNEGVGDGAKSPDSAFVIIKSADKKVKVAGIEVRRNGVLTVEGLDSEYKRDGTGAGYWITRETASVRQGVGDSVTIPLEPGDIYSINVTYRTVVSANRIGNVPKRREVEYNWARQGILESGAVPTLDGISTGVSWKYSYTGVEEKEYDNTGTLVSNANPYGPDTLRPTNAGRYEVTVQAWDGTRYATDACSLIIKPKLISAADVRLGAGLTYTYDGTAQVPIFTMVDGNSTLRESDYRIANTSTDIFNNQDAGTATFKVTGAGNFVGSTEGTFTINKKALRISAVESTVGDVTYPGLPTNATAGVKVYDGTLDVDTADITVVFQSADLVSGEDIDKNSGYFVTRNTFTGTNSDVQSNGTVRVRIELNGDDDVAKNYVLVGDSLTKAGVRIVKVETNTIAATDLADHFTFNDPAELAHGYTGTTRGIGPVTFKSPRRNHATASNASNTITVLYRLSTTDPSNDTTIVPKDIGTYTVSARIANGTNYEAGTVVLGEYTIGEAQKPVIVNNWATPVQGRQGSMSTLTVDATSPNEGTLLYQWYRSNSAGTDTTKITVNATSAAFNPSTAAQGTFYYKALVTNSKAAGGNVFEIASDWTGLYVIAVGEPAKDLSSATVTIGGQPYVYDGTPKEPLDVNVLVTLVSGETTDTLINGTDYTYIVTNNVNAGRPVLRVTGIEAYVGTVSERFTIEKKALRADDLVLEAVTKPYNGAVQPAVVKLVGNREGLGEITAIQYNGLAAEPSEAGVYEVTVTVGDGANFTASTGAIEMLDMYTIAKKAPAAADLLLNGVAFTGTLPTGLIANGEVQGIGEAALKGTGSGEVAVVYRKGGVVAEPIEAGVYEVAITVAGGANYLATPAGGLSLGSYTIAVPASDADRVAAAKSAIEGATYTTTSTVAGTAASAKAFVETAVAALLGNSPVVAVVSGTFTAPEEETAGSYVFTVALSLNDASATTVAKTLSITVSIASNDRVIPGSGSEVVVVAPVQVVAGEFTVGPNPVAKASGKVGFFWQGKAVKSGTLYVFDASGNLVTKAAVSDKGTGTDRREIGSWNLTANGAPVAEGTYLVKGVLVGKDGSKVKVSSILGVAR